MISSRQHAHGHSLGENYSWNFDDSVDDIPSMIAQGVKILIHAFHFCIAV